jgi:hypothetical protein
MKPGSTVYTLAPREAKNGPQHVLNPDKDRLDRNKFQVKANFFELKKHPKHLYEYSVTLGNIVLPVDSEGAQRTRSITRRDEKNNLFLALGKLAPLNSIPWGHSLTSVWTVNPLSNDLTIPLEFANVPFLGKNGRQETMDNVQLRFIGPLIEVKDQPAVSAERERSITGLNALVASAISKNPPGIFQTGANKFFIQNGWTRLDNGRAPDLLAYRGYSFSARITTGGMFINVNTSSSAFFAPVPLSSVMTTFCKDYSTGLNVLKSLSVRRIYDIQLDNAEDTKKVNGVERRLKTITEFGKPPAAQLCKFAHGKTTVAAYFAGMLVFLSSIWPAPNSF